MTISGDTAPNTDTDLTLNKLAKAGAVEDDMIDTEDKAATVVSTQEDLAEAAKALTKSLQQAGIEPEIQLPTPATKTKKKSRKKTTKKTAKAKAKKTAKTAAKKTAPSSGQSGPAIADLAVDELNDKEMKVMKVFPLKGDRETFTITDLAKGAWPTNTQGKSNSWTRNSLRRLVRGGFIEKLKRGSYRISVKGRHRMEKAA